MSHPLISQAVVVGLHDSRYGEIVAAFLKSLSSEPLSPSEIRDWVTQQLGQHKAPARIFWFGHGGVPKDLPLTGSGKIRKYELAKLGNELVRASKLSRL